VGVCILGCGGSDVLFPNDFGEDVVVVVVVMCMPSVSLCQHFVCCTKLICSYCYCHYEVVNVVCGSASKLPLVVLRGFELTEDYLIKNGFRRPILVRCKDGLDLQVPPDDFSVQDVEEYVGMLMVSVWFALL